MVELNPSAEGGPAARAMSAISRLLAAIETGLAILAAIAMAAIMLIVVLDVVMRYVLSAPLGWSYDVIGLYLMVAAFFLMLPDALHAHSHVSIDLLMNALPRWLRNLGLAFGYAAGAVVVALIGLEAWGRFLVAFDGQDRIAAIIPWLTWPAYLIVVVGTAMLTLRMIYRAVGHALSLFFSYDLVELPPPPESAMPAARIEL